MKKVLILIYISLFAAALAAQSGSGTSGDPFYGTISTSVEWNTTNPPYSSTIYVGNDLGDDLTITTDGHLTIAPGITVIFTQLTSDLIITGSGILTAEGTRSNQILFTKAADKSHWGHISFETPGTPTPITGTGSFDYCVVEYGYAATSGTNPDNAGGGIQVNANDVTIDNCFFENNYSNFGGAITAYVGRNTIIKNSRFNNNTANSAGGAILLYTNSTALVENCLFEYNTCNGVGSSNYSGGAIWQYSNTSKIINSTFVENNSARAGDAISLRSSTNGRIINCILWGSNDQFAGTTTTSTIVTCAFEDTKPANALNSIIISDIDSDHFNDAGSGDWSIKFISPCRDAGTTPDPTVPNDYIGNPRINKYDIGAYEVQYSRWTGATSDLWGTLSNWDEDLRPTSNISDVVIPSGLTYYPTGSSTQDFNIGSGKYLFVEPGARLTLDNLSNSGSLTLESDASAISSLILAGYSGAGTATIQLFLKGGTSPDNMWHYIAVPHDMNKSVLTAIEPYNLLRFDDSRITTSTYEGWQWHDGWDGFETQPGDAWTTLEYKRGYDFYHSADTTIEYDALAISPGLGTITLNNHEDDMDPNSLWGLNLIGNSLTCTIDWESVSFSDEDSVRNAIYITIENTIASYINGVGTNGGTQYIPPLQGFFVRTLNDGEYIDFSNAKTHSDQARFKGMETIPLIRLEISNESGNRDETVVRFDYNATEEFDSRFDASKILSQSLVYPQIYSIIGNEKYSINGLPFPDDQLELIVPVKITSPGLHTISSTQIQGIENYKVYLIDKDENNYTINLNEIPEYSFSSLTGTFDDRFRLKVTNVATGLDDMIKTDHEFNMYTYSNLLNIQTLADEWSGVRAEINMYDLTGRIIGKYPDVELFAGETKQLPFNQPKGIYIVEIIEGGKRVVQKVSHR